MSYRPPAVSDFGRIELHTYQLPGSGASIEEPTSITSAGGGGIGAGVGLLGLIGGAAALAGRDGDNQPVAVADNDEEEKHALK